MTDRGDKAFQEFLSEAQEIVESLSRDLGVLEAQRQAGQRDPDVVNSAFRAVHSLKGLAGNNDLASAVQAVIEGQAVYEQLEANLGLGDTAAAMPGGWERLRTRRPRTNARSPPPEKSFKN